jgi:hypothetical protein
MVVVGRRRGAAERMRNNLLMLTVVSVDLGRRHNGAAMKGGES